MPDSIKTALALRLRTDRIPERVDITSSGGQQTYMQSTEFAYREMNFDAAIRNDILTSSTGAIATEDTSKIWGDSFTIKLTFVKLAYQKLYEAILRTKVRPRSNNS